MEDAARKGATTAAYTQMNPTWTATTAATHRAITMEDAAHNTLRIIMATDAPLATRYWEDWNVCKAK